MADRRHNVGMATFNAARVSSVLIAGLVIAPSIACAESPLIHDRAPALYQELPAIPQPGNPAQAAPDAAKPEAAKSIPRSGSATDDPEFRFGNQPKRRPDDGKREMVDGKPLWNTHDPANKRGRFAFLGNKIGDPIETLFPKPDTEADRYGRLLCQATPGAPGFLDCADDGLREFVDGAWEMRYRGAEVSFVNYRFLDRKLIGFTMGFPMSSFPRLAQTLESQYGPADAQEQTDWRNRLGAAFDTKIMTWHTPHGTMALRSRAEFSPDAGSLELFLPSAEQRYEALRFKQVSRPPESAKEGAGKSAAPYDPYDR